LTIRHKNEMSKLMLPPQMHDIEHPWPVPPDRTSPAAPKLPAHH
jgi:hypothetical protein